MTQHVYFRQAGTCVVTRTASDTMCELNPQLRKELRELTSSREVAPSLLTEHNNAHRAGTTSEEKPLQKDGRP